MNAVESKSKSSHHMEKWFFAFILYLREMMDVHKTYCGRFMMFVSQINILYNLNLSNAEVSIQLEEKRFQKNLAIFRELITKGSIPSFIHLFVKWT